MTLPTGIPRASSVAERRLRGFTLIELILVMSLMLVILSLTGATLSEFFKGRALNSEARRFLSLTHYAQSRAVSEGIPMVLWVDPLQRLYGVESEYSFSTVDEASVEYRIGEGLEILMDFTSSRATTTLQSSRGTSKGRGELQIRFAPDGFLSETAPRNIWVGSVGSRSSGMRDNSAIWMTPNATDSAYEVQPSPGYAMRP